ncbi:U3 small nucleolar RNA-interacting protein 2-like isoform X2 [Lineus longissimus]|uniref:U3 small nucleolar RNA-interacting protein 2-like isoform X2 n=1 Tax=Lineus longissimus TaxID=88925 RepID=UPI00315CF978
MPFFIRNKNKSGVKLAQKRKVKGPTETTGSSDGKKRKKLTAPEGLNEEIESDSDIASDAGSVSSGNEEEVETAQEKRLRLAKQYLAHLEKEEAEKEDDDAAQRDLIGHRLREDVLEQAGKLYRQVAAEYVPPSSDDIKVLRGHKLPITCLVISPDAKHVFTGSKDFTIIKWDVAEGKKIHTIKGGKKGEEETHKGHCSHILSLAIASDAKFMVSGDKSKLIHVWNPDTCEHIKTLRGHRDAVSALSFRNGTHQLYSASHDRSVKVWNLDEMAYVETLFGHQDHITAIDSLSRERCITSGGRDKSVRVWKIIEESQLVFHGHNGSIDCVSLINDSHFVSGADDNSIALWSVLKKKPAHTVQNAHSGADGDQNGKENWISAIVSLKYTDLVASGSRDGCIRLWQVSEGYRSLKPLFSIPVVGFVNSLQFSPDGGLLIAGVGQEHKWGRWWRKPEAKNSVIVIKLNRETKK